MSAVHYFAYGSNMSDRVFRGRVKGRAVGSAALHGWRLAFSLPSKRWGGRAADIALEPGASVWGRLWLVDAEAIAALDQWEANYRRIEVEVHQPDDPESVVAVTYVVRDTRRASTEGRPAPEYQTAMLEGAAEARLPGSYVQSIESVGTDAAGGPSVVGTSTAGR